MENLSNIPSPSFAVAVKAAMIERKLNPLQLSKKLDYSYDYMRQVCSGEKFPGQRTIAAICAELGLDAALMTEMVAADKALIKFPRVMEELEPLDCTEFGAVIREALIDANSSPLRLAADTNYSYDYIRKVVKSEAKPGRTAAKAICAHLGFSADKTAGLLAAL